MNLFKQKPAPIEQVNIGGGVAELTLIPSVHLAILYISSGAAPGAVTDTFASELEAHLQEQGYLLQVFAP